MVQKERETRSDSIESLLRQVLEQNQKLQSEINAIKGKPSRAKKLSAPKPEKIKLQKVSVPGTGSKFWSVVKPVSIRQSDADSGRYYVSAKGQRIRVFFINKNHPQAPVIGAIEISPGIWDCRVWNYDGGTRVPHYHGNNIVGFWKE